VKYGNDKSERDRGASRAKKGAPILDDAFWDALGKALEGASEDRPQDKSAPPPSRETSRQPARDARAPTPDGGALKPSAGENALGATPEGTAPAPTPVAEPSAAAIAWEKALAETAKRPPKREPLTEEEVARYAQLALFVAKFNEREQAEREQIARRRSLFSQNRRLSRRRLLRIWSWLRWRPTLF
jgi:hypothetical protein